MKKEYDFKKGKVHRGPIVKSKGIKIQKTFRIDLEIYNWLVKEGQRKGIPYQTLMNSILKSFMENNEMVSLEKRIRRIEALLKETRMA
jgi:uncharacterized protein (DUF4415 family)